MCVPVRNMHAFAVCEYTHQHSASGSSSYHTAPDGQSFVARANHRPKYYYMPKSTFMDVCLCLCMCTKFLMW